MSSTGEQLRAAIFLDRDGTIIEDVGHLGDPRMVTFLPGAVAALQRLQKRFTLFIVTNQSGVAKGLLTLDQVATVNAYVTGELASLGVPIAQVFVCPHARSDGCECIKPKPYFLNLAAREYAIDLKRSFTIGDHPHDVEFAHSVGATGIYVLTGHGEKHRKDVDPASLIAPSLAEALPLFERQ
jgi:D-glycero-D-manno-heptose 1,7-bisphosphate phosphatase